LAGSLLQGLLQLFEHARFDPGAVLSYNEIPDNRQIRVISTIGRNANETG
jgi:hypothetical protein